MFCCLNMGGFSSSKMGTVVTTQFERWKIKFLITDRHTILNLLMLGTLSEHLKENTAMKKLLCAESNGSLAAKEWHTQRA